MTAKGFFGPCKAMPDASTAAIRLEAVASGLTRNKVRY